VKTISECDLFTGTQEEGGAYILVTADEDTITLNVVCQGPDANLYLSVADAETLLTQLQDGLIQQKYEAARARYREKEAWDNATNHESA
jgi:hypothetical protein